LKPDQWEANAIIGEKIIDGRKYYMVAWNPTLEPEEDLANIQDLIEEWRRNMASAKRSAAISKRENDGNRDRGRSDQIEIQPNGSSWFREETSRGISKKWQNWFRLLESFTLSIRISYRE
jgi:hypothetical protein